MEKYVNSRFPIPDTLLLSGMLALLGCIANVWAQPTSAFTYQGKLTEAGNPANGDYELEFKLYDAPNVGTGTQQGATLQRDPVTASAGVFTVTLDFGANVFSGADRFLEIGVRPDGSASAYTVLSPRQPITSSPYAIQTLNSQQLGGLPASGFIQNSSSPQAGANFNIGGKGTAASLDVNGAVTQVGSATPAVAPIGQGRIYFDAATNKVKVSESGAPFVDLVHAPGEVPAGGIILWDSTNLCPTGYTAVTTAYVGGMPLDNFYLRATSSAGAGTVSGNSSVSPAISATSTGTVGSTDLAHTHLVSGTADGGGSHSHTYSSSYAQNIVAAYREGTGAFNITGDHTHSGTTSTVSSHTHSFSAASDAPSVSMNHTHSVSISTTGSVTVDLAPLGYGVLMCRKN